MEMVDDAVDALTRLSSGALSMAASLREVREYCWLAGSVGQSIAPLMREVSARDRLLREHRHRISQYQLGSPSCGGLWPVGVPA